MHSNDFSYGVLTPILAYAMSFIGSVLGLQCMYRARAVPEPSRTRWIALGAVAIGGIGIWVMHFIAMLGFSVDGQGIRYDVPLTLASLIVAILVVGVGLSIAVRGGGDLPGILGGGVITGSGVAAMHYLGMGAMRMDAPVRYDIGTVAISECIAVVAATAALWFTLHIRRLLATIGAALIMGVAVTGMHYTGMAALTVVGPPPSQSMPGMAGMAGTATFVTAGQAQSGMSAAQLMTPLVIGVSVVTALIMLVVAMAPTAEELRQESEMSQTMATIRSRDEGDPLRTAG